MSQSKAGGRPEGIKLLLSNLFVVVFIVVFISIAYFNLGKVPAVVFSVATIGGFILWIFTTYRTPIDTQNVIIPYLFAVVLFIVHVYEEYIMDFEVAMTDIFGFHVAEQSFLTIAAFTAPAMWVIGAILIIKKTHIGFYFLSLFFCWHGIG